MVVGEPVSTSAVAGTPSMQTFVVGIVPREIPGSSFAGGSTPWRVTETSPIALSTTESCHSPSVTICSGESSWLTMVVLWTHMESPASAWGTVSESVPWNHKRSIAQMIWKLAGESVLSPVGLSYSERSLLPKV